MIKVHSVEQKTEASIKAFKKIQETSKKTRKINYSRYYPKASADLTSKKEYMQSEAFWHDPQNVEMARITKWLMQARDAVKEMVDNSYGGLKQATNGYSVCATELRLNPNLNFVKSPSHKTSLDMSLYNAKLRLSQYARDVKNSIK